MNEFLKTLSQSPLPWLKREAPLAEVVLSTRLRLARNIKGMRYPSSAASDERLEVLEAIFEASEKLPEQDCLFSYELDTLSDEERLILNERRLFCSERIFGSECGLVVEENEEYSFAVNSRDHLHIQAFRPGLQLQEAWVVLERLDDLLAQHLEFDFSDDCGFLTSSPADVGTGLKASLMVDLSGLVMTGQIGGALQASRVLGFSLTVCRESESQPIRHRYFLTTNKTLGVRELEVLDQLSSYVNDLAAVELRARAKVLADYPYRAMDSVSRAYGLLRYCWLIDEDDAVEALLTLRFGVEMGLFGELTHKMIEQALTYSLRAHLQGVLRGNLHIEDLKRARALMVRKHLKCSH